MKPFDDTGMEMKRAMEKGFEGGTYGPQYRMLKMGAA